MVNSLRKSDSAAEIEIGKFLDCEFYPKHVTNMIRYNDLENQMLGIDVKFDYQNLESMLVDEKVAAHYVNKDIPTFAFEVNFLLQSGILVNGWLFDENKKTGYYLLGWIWAIKDNCFLANEITKIDIVIVNRNDVIRLLSDSGLTKESAFNISKEIRAGNVSGVHFKTQDKPYYFYYSTLLAEKPINIIIKKSALVNISIGRHLITGNSRH